MRQCYQCGWEWKKPHQPAFRELCPRCDSFLHCCKNCSLYDRTVHHQCKSPTVEPIADKEKGNFCDEYRFLETSPPPKPKPSKPFSSKAEEKLDPREKWRRLFKDDADTDQNSPSESG